MYELPFVTYVGRFMLIAPKARELYELRRRYQGESWWQTIDAKVVWKNAHQKAAIPKERDEDMEKLAGLQSVATLAGQQGNFTLAADSLTKAAAAERELFGKDTPDYARLISDAGYYLILLGRLDEAEPLLRDALAIREQLYGVGHPQLVNTMTSLARVYYLRARLDDAAALSQAVLGIRKRINGTKSVEFAEALSNLANVVSATGRYEKAEGMYRAALAQMRNKDATYAVTLDGLVAVLDKLGKSTEAERQAREAVQIWKDTLDTPNTDYVRSLNNLATVLSSLGRLSEAASLYQQALGIIDALPDANWLEYAVDLNNLANLLRKLNREQEGETLCRKGLEIAGSRLGVDHPYYAATLNNLGNLLVASGQFDQGVQTLRQAVTVLEQNSRTGTFEYAVYLNDLALALRRIGRSEDAEPLLRQVLETRASILGKQHPDFLRAEANLSSVLLADPEHLRDGLRLRLDAARGQRRRASLVPELTANEQAQFRYQDAGAGISLAGLVAVAPGEFRREVIEEVLLEKRFQNDVGRQENEAFRLAVARSSASWRKDYGLRQTLVSQLAARFARERTGLLSEPARPQMSDQELQMRIETLEKQLRQTNAVYAEAARMDEVTLADIEHALRPGQALVEIVLYRPYDWTAVDETKGWGVPHYLAVIVRPNESLESEELGPAIAIDQIVQEWQTANRTTIDAVEEDDNRSPYWWRQQESVLGEKARMLRKLLWLPVERHLKGVKRVYLGPDGELALMPFEALAERTAQGTWHYLAEDWEIVYLNTGRDLARLALQRATRKGMPSAVVVSNPDFDATPEEMARALYKNGLLRRESARKPANLLGLSTGTGSEQRSTLRTDWPPLGGIADRFSTELKNLLKQSGWQVRPLTGVDANKEAVLEIRPPRLLQFVTHGYVLDEDKNDTAQNPLLRSLLVLAGANNRAAEGPVVYRVGQTFVAEADAKQKLSQEGMKRARVEVDDGFLTAYEVAQMNLFGTEMVSLTACETGLGMVTADGVAGLRQAFQAAGARSMTMSMFEVPTKETLAQATDFYRRWLGGSEAGGHRSRYEAFRVSQQAALERARKRRNTGHPFFWSGPVYSGDPGDLPTR